MVDRKRDEKTLNIVMCRMVRVTKITGYSSDDWIYWRFVYSLF
jgi:hypothetical protein